jgi:hypothetical protein
MYAHFICLWQNFFDYIKFTFNQTTFLYPVFDADYESEIIFLIRMNIKNIVTNYELEWV